MDSSAIVCVADNIIVHGAPSTSRLDTISWYDDTYDHIEPDMNERPYFSRVEQKRGQVGYHIDLGALRARTASQNPFIFESMSARFPAIPDSMGPIPEIYKQYAGYMTSSGHRVTISGIGGGEVTGDGVPTPTPELQNLLATARLFTFVHQLNAWAAKMRRPRLALFWEAVRGFLYRVSGDESNWVLSFPWLNSDFVRRNMTALYGYPSRVQLFGPLPSIQHNLRSLAGDRRLLANWTLHPEFLREVRLPYFDRDLLEFMYGIPREQVVRVGQRRSLMKRALAGVVPDELLNRKRKAAVPQQSFEDPPVASLIAMAPKQTVGSSQGIIDQKCFSEYLQIARDAGQIPFTSLKRTLTLELWLRHLMMDRVLLNSPIETHTCSFSLGTKESQNHGEAPHGLR
jgi:asparagine synthase (glutamine-hydrolysing)